MNTEKNNKIWVEKCVNTLKLGGRSNKTILNYRSAWNRFFHYFDTNKNITKLNEEEIATYFYQEFIIKKKCDSYYNLNLCAIRFLFSICFQKELNRKLIPRTKVKNSIPSIVPKDIFLKIFNEEKHLNHKCWLILAFCSGLRVEEVAKVRVENIFSSEHKLKVLGKGNKERFTLLPDVTIKFLRLYYKSKQYSFKKGYLFKGTNNKDCMNEKTIINYFSSLKVKYNLNDTISFHSLRHSFATYYLTNGGSLLTLQSMLGHSNLNTTTIYLHLSQNFNNLEGVKYV